MPVWIVYGGMVWQDYPRSEFYWDPDWVYNVPGTERLCAAGWCKEWGYSENPPPRFVDLTCCDIGRIVAGILLAKPDWTRQLKGCVEAPSEPWP